MRAAPAVRETTPHIAAVAVAGERRGLPLAHHLLTGQILHAPREPEDLRAVAAEHGVAEVSQRLGVFDLRHPVPHGGDRHDQLRLAALEIHQPQPVVRRPGHIAAGVLAVAAVPVIGTRQAQPRIVDAHRPLAVRGDGAHRIGHDAPGLGGHVEDHGHELAVHQIVEDEVRLRRRGQPVRHGRLLEIPAARVGQRKEAVVVLRVHHPEHRDIRLGRQTALHVRLQHRGVAPVRAPRVDGVVAREKVVLGTGRDRPRLANRSESPPRFRPLPPSPRQAELDSSCRILRHFSFAVSLEPIQARLASHLTRAPPLRVQHPGNLPVSGHGSSLAASRGPVWSGRLDRGGRERLVAVGADPLAGPVDGLQACCRPRYNRPQDTESPSVHPSQA